MGVSINLYVEGNVPLSSLWCWYYHLHAHLLHMTITICNSHPFTFYLPFHTSPPVDQYPIHAPSTCTLVLDPCARHSLFGRTDPYYTDKFYSSCGLQRLAATLAFPLLCNCTVLPVPLSTGPYLDPAIANASSGFALYDARKVANFYKYRIPKDILKDDLFTKLFHYFFYWVTYEFWLN